MKSTVQTAPTQVSAEESAAPLKAVSERAPQAKDSVTLEAVLEENRQLRARLDWVMEQLRRAKSKLYGPSSEATKEQVASLFDEAELFSSPTVAEPPLEAVVPAARGVKREGKREADLAGLQVEEIRHELPESERICPVCEGQLHEATTDVTDKLEVVPATWKVVKHIRVNYGCRHCENHGDKATLVRAPMAELAFPKSLASPSSVSHLIVNKFDLALPLYRQERYLQGMGINLSRQTMANWVIRGADSLLPLYERMHEVLKSADVLHADETRLQVLLEDGRSAEQQSFMWVYRTGRGAPPLVFYEYEKTREANHPQDFLKGFKGYLHVDGYIGYGKVAGVTLCGCWAHVRRNYEEALKNVAPEARDPSRVVAQQGLNFCNRLFRIERELSALTAEERFLARRERSEPLLREINDWLLALEKQALSASLLGKALTYHRNQWPKLQTFLLDGRLEIDNNRCERAVKPFVIGRKNWLFSVSPEGARASARLYSIVETAKENGLNAGEYLELLFEKMPSAAATAALDLDTLLPWSELAQARCKRP